MNTTSQLRQAAILVASLDSATADALLDQLSPDQADTVRRMVVALDEIDTREQDAAISQFLGVEEADATLPPSVVKAPAPVPRSGPPFQFLRDASGEQLLPLLRREHPQIVAVVLSHLPPEQAAELLFALPTAQQDECMRRLADLGETDATTIELLEQSLRESLGRFGAYAGRRDANLSVLASILQAAEAGPEPPQVPLPAQPSVEDFHDLWMLEDEALGRLFDHAEPQTTILALAGATEVHVDRVLAMLPANSAQRLRRAWRHLGPTNLSDIEAAQQELVCVARRLESSPSASPAELASAE